MVLQTQPLLFTHHNLYVVDGPRKQALKNRTCSVTIYEHILYCRYNFERSTGKDNCTHLKAAFKVTPLARVIPPSPPSPQNAAMEIVEKGLVDKEKVVALGGSHGGFITAHLVAQFPVSRPRLLYLIILFNHSSCLFTLHDRHIEGVLPSCLG